MNVPFLDLGAAYRELKTEIDAAVHRVLDSGWYILGPEVEAFEAEWAGYCGAGHAVGLANGLDALTLALRALDIGPGDEVIVPSNTYIPPGWPCRPSAPSRFRWSPMRPPTTSTRPGSKRQSPVARGRSFPCTSTVSPRI